MLLTTSQLHLSEIVTNDIKYIHALNSLPEVDEFNTSGIPESLDETQNLVLGWIDSQKKEPKERYTFSIVNKETNEFIGIVGLKMGKPNYRSAEIWYKLFPKTWKKGYATETVKEILRFCFNELKLHRIEAGCAIGNIGSIKVLEKCGFIREGQTRKLLPIRDNWIDNYFYAILEEDHNK
ncbi:MAG: GNAT family N-acetyltransferase [Bacteroidetes bacterium]|nr:GNAT family N-acetyltransferase [Bacteroidota bacterium]